MGEKSVETLVKEKPETVMNAFEKWFESIPEEEKDKSIIGIYSEPEPIVLSPREIYDSMKSSLTAGLSFAEVQEQTKVGATFIERVLKDFGGA